MYPSEFYTDMDKMPPPRIPNNSASGGNEFGDFKRQDSLTLAATLQERDRNQNCSMVDFMETSLDLENYLECFSEIDVHPDSVDFDDNELQKVNILYDDPIYCPDNNLFGEKPRYDNHTEIDRYESSAPSHSFDTEIFNHSQTNQMPIINKNEDRYKMQCEVENTNNDMQKSTPQKRSTRTIKPPVHFDESIYSPKDIHGEEIESDDCTDEEEYTRPPPTKRSRKGATSLENFKPQTTARKYTLKPESEKNQPSYKLKRARNNDAVRKSRNKAKELQRKREEEVEQMKKRIAELEGLLEAEKKARKHDRETIEALLKGSIEKRRQQ
ncbi:unnamed protein product [Caenorhabditis bovis]|uniref:BZIP domain-containing protein n=1 Tax=Caenorhabditis bovis TaxID=2654633 RepID=A0A8S1ELH5_9PELO|nr:unnamed protein product [Caenorhabditis bovis]